jgi:aldehyde dehydrogenase (NAD(P)+)
MFHIHLRRLYKAPSNPTRFVAQRRQFHSSPFVMSDISVQLTAPNGRSYTQPIGLFINNEFVAAKSGEKFATVNPSYVPLNCLVGL